MGALVIAPRITAAGNIDDILAMVRPPGFYSGDAASSSYLTFSLSHILISD
jgi:hypothetical protein